MAEEQLLQCTDSNQVPDVLEEAQRSLLDADALVEFTAIHREQNQTINVAKLQAEVHDEVSKEQANRVRIKMLARLRKTLKPGEETKDNVTVFAMLYDEFVAMATEGDDKSIVDYYAIDCDQFVALLGKVMDMTSDELESQKRDFELIFQAVDTDENGTLDRREFMCLVALMAGNGKEPDDQLKSCFQAFDYDASGFLEQDEIRNLYRTVYKLSQKNIKTEALMAMADNALAKLDTNQDGKLTVDEFLKIADVQPLILECITLHIPQLGIADEPDGIGI